MKLLTVGLLGGSFNPPHAGHIHISNEATKTIGVDQVWLLVAKQNPFKPNVTNSFNQRVKWVEHTSRNFPNIHVLDIENKLKHSYSYNVVKVLQKKLGHIHFIWIMGSDTLISFHKWYRWKDFFNSLPIAVFERQNFMYNSLKSRFSYQFYKYYYSNPRSLLKIKHGWSFIRNKVYPISSSQIRKSL